MTDWDNTIDCDFRGCPTRFPAHQLPHQRHCPWHGDQPDDQGLMESLAQKFVRGIAS